MQGIQAERDALIGRADDVAAVTQLLHEQYTRLVTITGPGGVGKTRAAMRVGLELDDHLDEGTVLVELRSIDEHDPDHVAQRIAADAGVLTVTSAGEDAEALVAALAGRQMLLILDNAEHLAEPVAEVVSLLLDHCPQLRLVVTSRAALDVPGEQQYPLPPLAAPDPDSSDWSPDEMATAVQLFRERARQVQPTFVVSTTDKHAIIARMCHRLGGFPLLIEIVAAKARLFSMEQIEQRLDNVFQSRWSLRSRRASWASTFSGVMSLSWQLCSPAEQAAWRRLSVFDSGFTVSAAADVITDEETLPADAVDEVLDSLVRQSLVHHRGEDRLMLLEPIRQAGWSQLTDAGEVQATRCAHSQWTLAWVHEAAQHWCGPDELAWLDAVHTELANVRSALGFFAEQGQLDQGAHLLAAVTRTRTPFRDGTMREWRQQLQRLLAAHEYTTSTRGWSIACAHSGWIGVCQGDPTAAEVIASARAAADAAGRPDALVEYAEAVYAVFGRGSAEAINQLQTLRQRLLGLQRPAGDLAMITMWWAIASTSFGAIDHADEATDTFLREAEDTGAPWHITWAQWARAVYLIRIGEHTDARKLLHTALPVQRTAGDYWGPIWWVAAAAWITHGEGRPRRTAELLGATDRVMELTGVRILGLRGIDERYHAAADYAATALGTRRYDAAYQAGRAIPDYGTACDLAGEAITLTPPEENTSRATAGVLSQRESEVAELVATGLTNKEIAQQLVVAQATVKNQVASLLTKLNCSHRGQVQHALQEIPG